MNAQTSEKESPRAGQATGDIANKESTITSPDPAQVRRAAIQYLRRGWLPIPVAHAEPGNADSGKAPTLNAWQNHITTEAELGRFWPDGSSNNIGITCGPSRLVVLDFDTPDAFTVWKNQHVDAINTFTVARTNAEPGRVHLYFALSEGQIAPKQLTKMATGWGDLKSAGGQVVAPPSIHYSGGRYMVINHAELLPWRTEYTPDLYFPALKGRKPFHLPEPGKLIQKPGIPPSVKAMIESGALEGSRNATAFAAAIQLRDEGHPEETALSILQEFANRCTPPMESDELMRTVASAFKSPAREPARNPNAQVQNRVTGSQAMPVPTPDEAWSEPTPLGDLDETLPAWPWDLYPRSLRGLGMSITETMNVPAELPGLALLCAASIACRKVATIAIKDDHRQFPNLYGMAAMPAATGKSPATRPIAAPLIAHQIQLRKAFLTELREWQGRNRVARSQIAALEKEAKADSADTLTLATKIAGLEAIEDERPAEPILIADNCTSEAMARTLARNGGKLGVFTADGRDVLSMARGRYTKDGDDVGVWLKSHAGDYLAYHRSDPNKLPFECPEPILSAFVAVQPDALKALGASKTLRESGFLARWLFCLPDTPGMVNYPEGSVPSYVARDYSQIISGLLEIVPDIGENDEPIPHVCRMDNSARACWIAAHDKLKSEALSAPPLLAQCLGKLPEHIARIALVFHLVECIEAGDKPRPIITPPVVERAITLASVLLTHIKRAVSMMGESGPKSTARELWPILAANRDKLMALRAGEGLGDICAVKPRDIARYGWAGIQDTTEARTTLDVLEVRGWLKLRIAPSKGFARDHELFELHPGPERHQ